MNGVKAGVSRHAYGDIDNFRALGDYKQQWILGAVGVQEARDKVGSHALGPGCH